MASWAWSPEQEALREQARAVLERSPAPTLAEIAELGWTAISVPEEHGGLGLGFVEEAILHEEIGRGLARTVFSSTAVILPALPPEEQARVAAGEAAWVLALGPLVPHVAEATDVAIIGGDGIYELVGATIEALETVDETRPVGVVAGGEAGRLLSSSELLPLIRTRSLAALACEACGVASAALDLAVAYTKERRQFGRVIGTYQAVAHPLATAYVELELARSLSLRAAWCVATATDDAGLRAAAAKAYAAETAVTVCERAIQAHGGIGFTWEHDLHRYYKRALWIRAFEASSAQLRSEIADRLI
ncbi:MAG: acyl-CoA dehydrogenase [Actinobacteria bacterium]|nr:acyl-CoA dehydrogenase [Actinomycetota bacterium]